MTGISTTPAPAAPTRTERAVLLGGFVLAAPATAWSAVTAACPGPVPGPDIETVGAAWLAAGAWAALSSLALALRRGFRHGDWSPFRRYRLPDGPDSDLDIDTRTGMYAYLRDEEDRLLHDDDRR